MPLQFVNYQGDVLPDPVALRQYAKAKKKPTMEEKSYHKGWKVTGIPLGALEEARAEALRLGRIEEQNGRAAKEFNEANWLQNHRGKAVRSKPYETQASATECAALATKSGWLRVRIDEVKRKVKDTDEIAPF